MVWSLSRKHETILTVAMIVVSLTALGVVIGLVILPSVPHEEPVLLREYTDCEIMRIETYKTLQTNHPISKANKKLSSPCWLSIQFLVSTGPGAANMFTSFLDLPYGTTGQNYTTACAPALAFRNRHPPASFTMLFIDTTDQNNAFFNESTGSSAPDWFLTYDNSVTPPTLHVTETIGDGIGIGGGFMLTACIVCFLLGVGFAALRCWEDRHPRSLNADDHRRFAGGPNFSSLDEAADNMMDEFDEEDADDDVELQVDDDGDDEKASEFERFDDIKLQGLERHRDDDDEEEEDEEKKSSPSHSRELELQEMRDEESKSSDE